MANYIYIGSLDAPLIAFYNNDIKSVNTDNSVNMVGQELNIDVLEAVVIHKDTSVELSQIPYGSPVWFYNKDNLVGKYYFTGITRTGKYEYQIDAVSSLGILEKSMFYGGMYDGVALKDLISLIVRSNGLQKYSGKYAPIKMRITEASPAQIKGIALGYYHPSFTSLDYECQLTAKMSARVQAKFTFWGYDNACNGTRRDTTYKCCLLGCPSRLANYDDVSKYYTYGIMMVLTRSSASVDYPEAGELFFVYGNQSWSLGNAVVGQTYEVDINPPDGTAIINDTVINITKSAKPGLAPIHCWGGGAYITSYQVSTNTQDQNALIACGNIQNHDCKLDCYYYRVYDESGNKLIDAIATKDVITGEPYIFDLVSRYYGKVTCAEIDDSEYEAVDDWAFTNESEMQRNLMNDIVYGDGVDSLLVYGWLSPMTKRNAINQILFSLGVLIQKGDNGSILFSEPYNSELNTIDDDHVYIGGKVEYLKTTSDIELTEHSYTYNSSASPEVLYENQEGASEDVYIVTFDKAPIYGQLSGNGIEVLTNNCNAAIVRGTGSISGVPYVHGKNVISRHLRETVDDSGKTVSVSDATLVTLQNSQNVLDRLSAYYSADYYAQNDINTTFEKCGSKYISKNAFGQAFQGYIEKMVISASGILKSTCTLISGYVPPRSGRGYKNSVVLIGSGTFEVPSEVFEEENPRIRVVLVGGGSGGCSGFAGEDGVVCEGGWVAAEMAEGGSVGASGSGGKILDVTIDNPLSSYNYECGIGGSGGEINYSHDEPIPGESGTDTVFGTYTSEDGNVSETGVTNFFTKEVYGRPIFIPDWGLLQDWLGLFKSSIGRGGDGGYTVKTDDDGLIYKGAGMVLNKYNSTEGAAGTKGTDISGIANGGCGGGAGFGQSGSNGTNASKSGSTYYCGNGGNGGNAVAIPPKATDYNSRYFGYGGIGGGGGGGGGCSGTYASGFTGVVGTAGIGGYGGKGGDGGDGCVLIYY